MGDSSMQRTAVVTGGAGGIGGAIVRALGATGHEVAILDREGEFAVDLGDEQEVRRVVERLGPRDVLVHAAAAFDRASLADVDLATWRRVQSVNVEAALWLCQALTPGMTRARLRPDRVHRLEHGVETAGRRLPALRREQGGADRARPVAGQAARRARDHGQLRRARV